MIGETIVTIVSSIVGSGTVAGVITAVMYRKQNKALKENEVTNSDLDNESKKLDNDVKQMDVGTLYLEKVQKLADMMEESAMRVVESTKSRDNDWAELKKDVGYLKGEMGLMVEYLDGDYNVFKNEKKKNGKKENTRKSGGKKNVRKVRALQASHGQVAEPGGTADAGALPALEVADHAK